MTAIFMVWNSSGLAIAADKSVSATEGDIEGNRKYSSMTTKVNYLNQNQEIL